MKLSYLRFREKKWSWIIALLIQHKIHKTYFAFTLFYLYRLFLTTFINNNAICCCEIIDAHPVVKFRFVFYDWASGHQKRTFEMATWQNIKGLHAKKLWPHTTCFLFAMWNLIQMWMGKPLPCNFCLLVAWPWSGWFLVLYVIYLGYEYRLNRLVEVWFIGEILNISILP